MIRDSVSIKDYKYAQKCALHIYYYDNLNEDLFDSWFNDVNDNEKDLIIF